MVHLRKRRSLFAKLSSHKKEEYKKEKNNANEEDIKPKFVSFTCGEPGHFFPNCPKQETKNPPSKSNECLNCGEEGHWANKFPHKNLFAGPFKKKDIFAKNCPLLRWLLWRPRGKKDKELKEVPAIPAEIQAIGLKTVQNWEKWCRYWRGRTSEKNNEIGQEKKKKAKKKIGTRKWK